MTQQPRLKIAIASYGHSKDIKGGAAAIAGVEPDFVEVVPIIGAFRRMVRDVEFDVCEMAPTTYMIALGAPFIALPVFLMRRFHHGGFVVRPDSGIKVPKDLEGKKVGVRAYSVTTGVWTRGIFINEYGLDSSKVTWVVDDEEHVTALKLPPNVVHAPEGKSLQSMMKAGEIQAGFTGPAGVGRAGPPISGWDKASEAAAAADTYPELIANVEQVEADWFRRSGIYPIHGLVVVKDEHIKRYPGLARSLMNAFVAAKKPYLEELKRGHGDSPEDKRYRNFLSLMSDPLPYGMAANRPSIEALITYSLQQKLIPSRPQLDQVFVDIDP
jgi:4,5-dihydroxyphthalate decarboxylase